jgi:carbon-monoxide dehydrogenase medium subunit
MRAGILSPKILVDVKSLPGMNSIEYDPGKGLRFGAGVNMNAIAHHPDVVEYFPLLVESIGTIASYQLRSRATIGGNLCNASPAADTAPAILVLEANLLAIGSRGERKIPANSFFLNPGENSLRPDEILARIDIPSPPQGWRGRYMKLGRNAQGDLAIVGVAVIGFPDGSTSSNYQFRIALASVAPTPIRVQGAEQILADNPITDETINQAANAAREASQPIDDVRASARYRREMVMVLTRRCLVNVWDMLQEEG